MQKVRFIWNRIILQTDGIYSSCQNSFSESRKDTDEELINTGKAAIWKVKWLLCICIFVMFVLCDKGKLSFPGTAGEKNIEWMYQQLEENYDYTKLQKYVMMISDFVKNK